MLLHPLASIHNSSLGVSSIEGSFPIAPEALKLQKNKAVSAHFFEAYFTDFPIFKLIYFAHELLQ